MNEIAVHIIDDWPVIRLVYTSEFEYEVQVNEATGYDHFNWQTVHRDYDCVIALHHYSERMIAKLYNQCNQKAPAVTFLYHNMYG